MRLSHHPVTRRFGLVQNWPWEEIGGWNFETEEALERRGHDEMELLEVQIIHPSGDPAQRYSLVFECNDARLISDSIEFELRDRKALLEASRVQVPLLLLEYPFTYLPLAVQGLDHADVEKGKHQLLEVCCHGPATALYRPCNGPETAL
jgi:hypothetical protein